MRKGQHKRKTNPYERGLKGLESLGRKVKKGFGRVMRKHGR
jgi:hypothetical protein